MTKEHQATQHKERRKRRRAPEESFGHGICRILVCIDGSPAAGDCIAQALAIADTFHSEVTLMHVIAHHDDNACVQKTDPLGWELARQETWARLERLEREALKDADRKFGLRLEQGRPAERIIALARELAADLVILGSSPHSGDLFWETSRTAQRVLAATPSSVLIVRGSRAARSFVPPQRVLVPLDGSARTESVLPTAEKIASRHGAQLLLVHIVEEPQGNNILAMPADLQLAHELATRLEAQASRYLDALCHQVGHRQPLVAAHVDRQADTRQSLVELAAREHIDLVVLSAHGCNCSAARPFGSVTGYLLAHSTVPLLILQDLEERALPANGSSGNRHATPLRGTQSREIA
jgi:nucleotide-binding universal stress UspA family protein